MPQTMLSRGFNYHKTHLHCLKTFLESSFTPLFVLNTTVERGLMGQYSTHYTAADANGMRHVMQTGRNCVHNFLLRSERTLESFACSTAKQGMDKLAAGGFTLGCFALLGTVGGDNSLGIRFLF